MPCAALILLGIVWRLPTLTHLASHDLFSFAHFAYSDVVKFYFTRHLAAHHLPYLQQDVEYPVLTGLVIWLTSFMPGIAGYFFANAVLLSACLLVSFALLARMNPGRLWQFALAPALALYVVLNWDALGLLGLVGGLYFCSRRQYLWAGACLAAGASAKLFPLFVLPVMVAYAAREGMEEGERLGDRAQPPLRLLAGFAAIAAALNLPFALLSWRGWSYFLTFQASRSVNPDSIWAHLPAVPGAVSSHIFVDAMVIGALWLAVRVWRRSPWQPAAMLSLLLFLLFTRDYSPQYDLWLLPFLALLACPLWLWLALVLADALYFAAIFLFYSLGVAGHGSPPVPVPDRYVVLGVTVWLRELMLLLLFVWGLAAMRGMSLSVWWNSLAGTRQEPRAEHWTWGRLSFGWKQALGLVLALRVAWGLIAFLSVHLEPVTAMGGSWLNLLIRGGEPWSQLISTWQRYDALWYQQIAEHGYQAGNGTAAFFPLYPLLSRVTSTLLVGHIVPAELLVSTGALTASLWLLYRLARFDVGPLVALLTVLLLAFFPTGFFLLAPYTESLFLMLTLASFWLARRGNPWLAGLAGLGAALTRAQGAFLVMPLAFVYLQQRDEEAKRPGFGLLASILPPLGLIAFTLYLHLVVGEPRSSLAVQSIWGYRVVAPWEALGASWQYITQSGDPIEILNLACLLGFSVLAVLGLWRLPLSYGLYALPYLALLFTREMAFSPLMSVSRFTLALFPCFLVLATILGKRPLLAAGWLVTSLAVQILLLEFWVHFGFVA